MPYKVVFVEDEIVTREGIRDNVDWKGNGFEFVGEASDGETALQILQSTKPDVLITDIKMPFMDGLQLGMIVRERMPWIKIVILSGHDEFEYAQQAIKLGVTEYLLKPVTVRDMHNVLHKIAAQLDQEKAEQEKLRHLQDQIDQNQASLRERFLYKLVVGAVSSTEVIENSQSLGLDLIARFYLVVIFKTELADRSEQFDYDEYQQILRSILSLIENNPDVFILKKDWEEMVLLIKGNAPETVDEEKDLIIDRIKREFQKTRYVVTVGIGTPKNRITYIYQSFIEALGSIQNAANPETGADLAVEKAELLKMDKSAVDNYLRSGAREGFNAFFDAFVRPLGETAFKSRIIKNYIFVDIVLAIARFVNELGGDIDQAIPAFSSIETILMNIKTTDQLREQVFKIVDSAIAFRDGVVSHQYAGMIQQSKEYIDQHYGDPDLHLNEVAARVNLSPSYFSVVFSQETGQTFKDYLSEVRIKKAKELLRSTILKSAEISYRVGYSDPHYFSYVFRKNTGFSPTEFRSQLLPK